MKTFRKLPIVAIAAALLVSAILPLVLTGCATAPVKREAGKAYELVLLHTNDHHGTVLPNGGRGGLAERATFIKSVKAANPNVLLMDAGDFNTGTALSNMFDGDIEIAAYNLMGYDAATFGNHEFDSKDLAKLNKQIANAKYPFTSANVKDPSGKFLGGHQYIVKNYEGIRVGIFGLTTRRSYITATLFSGNYNPGVVILNEIDAAKEAVAMLRNKEKVDIVIALTHIGDVQEDPDHITSFALAEAVPGIDIIVDGHTHSFFNMARFVSGAWVVTANEWGKYVGQAKLTVVDGKLQKFDWELVEINNSDKVTYAPDAAVTALLAPYIEKSNASLKEVIGEAADTFVFGNRLTRYQETTIGNMVCDANVWYFRNVFNQNIDFAFHNGGGIRAELPKGQLTREDILTVLPFENYLYIVSLTGTEILELFDFIATVPQGAGAFPQFSKEVRYTIDVPDKKISNLTIGGAPVDPNKTYRFCTNDFILAGGDGYTVMLKARDPFNASLLLSYVVIEYIDSQGGVITPSLDDRMTVIGGVTP